MLTPQAAARAGRRYGDGEFDLSALRAAARPARRDRTLLRAPGPPLRRRGQPDVGRYRPLPAPAQPALARWLRLGAGRRRRAHRRRRLGPGRRPSTSRRRRCGSGRAGPGSTNRRRRPRVRAAADRQGGSTERPRCRRCCAGTCGSAPGCAASPPTTRTSSAPTSTCCSPWTGWTRATGATSSGRPDDRRTRPGFPAAEPSGSRSLGAARSACRRRAMRWQA